MTMEELIMQGEQLALEYIADAYDTTVQSVLEVLEEEDEDGEDFLVYNETMTDYMNGFESCLTMLNITFDDSEEE